jgi:hypothetical protein
MKKTILTLFFVLTLSLNASAVEFKEGYYEITLVNGTKYTVEFDNSKDNSVTITTSTSETKVFELTGTIQSKINKLSSPKYYRQYIRSIRLIKPKDGKW